MEDERPIEKLLRRYAKKRRDEAGAPPELHPATRRLLQGEVSRQFKKERNEKKVSAEAPARWWPRWIYGLGGFAVAALLVAVWFNGLNKPGSSSFEMASAGDSKKKDLSDQRFAKSSDSLTLPGELAKEEVNMRASDERQKLLKSADDTGAEVTNGDLLAYADAPQMDRSLSQVRLDKTATLGAQVVSEAVPAAPVAMPPSAFGTEITNRFSLTGNREAATGSTLRLAERPSAGGGGGGARYKSADEVRGNLSTQAQTAASFSNQDKNASKAAVLVSFKVEQTGNELRVIDSDSSTYAGNIVAVVDQTEAEKTSSRRAEEKVPVRQIDAAAAVNSRSVQDVSAQNTYFRVSGTNKTLKQLVVFTGNILAVTNAAPSQMLRDSRANQMQNFTGQQMLPLQLNNSIIVGRAQLEKNVGVEVNAVPVLQR